MEKKIINLINQMEDETIIEMSDALGLNEYDSGWKYEPKAKKPELPDFKGKKVIYENGILKFDFLQMEYDITENELYIHDEEIELNSKFKCKNKESRNLFNELNNTMYKSTSILKDLKKYIKNINTIIKNTQPLNEIIKYLIEVKEEGVRSNALVQAVKKLLIESELIKTYNGFVMPQKNNICKPIRMTELYEFIEDICDIDGISSITLKEALSYFNKEIDPVFNKIVTANGYYDFETGEFHKSSKKPIIIKKASPYNYDPTLIGKPAPAKLNKFLKETFSDEIKKINALLEIFGYMLDDGNQYQIMPFFSGVGRNGKGVCLDLLSALVDDNISSVDIFSVDFGSKYSSPLIDSDINIMNEIKSTRNLAEVKEYVGQGGLHLSKLYTEPRKYKDIELPKTILATNNFKGLNNHIDMALMKRLSVFIEFNNVVPTEKQNPFILKELLEEEGAMDWLLTNSIDLYQKIRDEGTHGHFLAEHDTEGIMNHLERYINPIVHNIKKYYKYNNDRWEELSNDVPGNWDCFVGIDDIKDCLKQTNPEAHLISNKKMKDLILDAFNLIEYRGRHPDDYEGYWVISRPYNVETKEQKAVIRGVLKNGDDLK